MTRDPDRPEASFDDDSHADTVAASSTRPDRAPSLEEAATELAARPPLDTIRPPPKSSQRMGALQRLQRLAERPAAELFEPGDPIGEGGMGVVRAAVQRSIGRQVAVKTLRAEHRTPHAELALLREAWLTAALEHPHVVPVHDVLLDADRGPLVVLKRVDGVTWDEVIDDAELARTRFGALDLFEFNVEILMQLCRAVHFAHSHHIVHRDIKPSNVMIGSFGEVYLLDWGIAVSLTDDPSGRFPVVRESNAIAGTPCYMAPEMLHPRRGVSERTDVYLLGAVLYRIVAGRAPHEAADPDELVRSIERSRPRFDETVPEALRAVIARAMAPDPQDRHESAEALRLDLQQFLRNRASTLLVERALGRFVELTALFAKAEPPRDRLYELFGECRFGLQEALRSWPENQRARELLGELLDCMIEHLLAAGDAGAAGALLADHPAPGRELSERVEAAQAEERRQRAELSRLQRELDPWIGSGARRAAMVLMGVAWTLAPLAANLVEPSDLPTAFNYASPLVLLSLALVVWYRARASLNQTAINRRFLVAMLVGFCAHMVHVLITQLAALPAKSELAMGMVSFGAIAAVLSYTAERRLWPLVPLYWLGALAGAAYREQSAYVLSACNLVLTVYMFAIWSPSRKPTLG